MDLRLHLDEDTEDHSLILALRERGLDVTTTTQMGLAGAGDPDQLMWATRHQRALVTHNGADFCRLHKSFLQSDGHHAGIIIVPQQRFSIGEIMRRLLRLAAALNAQAMQDRLEFLSNW